MIMAARNVVSKRIERLASLVLGATLGLAACSSGVPLGEIQTPVPAPVPSQAPAQSQAAGGQAQPAAQPVQPGAVGASEEIVVTGVRRTRPSMASATPLATVDGQ